MAHVVVISDIHGNLAALEAVWKDISHRMPDHILFLGDAAAFGPEPEGVLALLRDEIQPAVALRGNTDRYLLEGVWKKDKSPLDATTVKSLAWTAERLGDDGLAYLDSLSGEQTYSVADVGLFLCHGAPGDDEQGINGDTLDDLKEKLGKVKGDLLLCGHTHLPYRARRTGREVINVGSVGYPFDGDQRACYLSFWVGDGRLQELNFCRVSYNRGRTIKQLAESTMPGKAIYIHRLEVARLESPRPEPPPES
jgi:putative phosphoesterase